MKSSDIIIILTTFFLSLILLAVLVLLKNSQVINQENEYNETDTPDPSTPPIPNPTPSPTPIGSDNVPDFCPLNYAPDAFTKNFKLSEFNSKGTAPPTSIRGNIQQLMNELQIIRDTIGVPIIVNSGYRTPMHNENAGGAKQSRHMCGQAADIKAKGLSLDDLWATINRLIKSGKIKDGGLSKYNTFIHYDIGPVRRW